MGVDAHCWLPYDVRVDDVAAVVARLCGNEPRRMDLGTAGWSCDLRHGYDLRPTHTPEFVLIKPKVGPDLPRVGEIAYFFEAEDVPPFGWAPGVFAACRCGHRYDHHDGNPITHRGCYSCECADYDPQPPRVPPLGRVLMGRSMPVRLAIFDYLTTFFGGVVWYGDDPGEHDPPHRAPEFSNNPSDGEEWNNLQHRLWNVVPLTRQKVNTYSAFAAYGRED